MTSLLGKIFGGRSTSTPPPMMRGDIAYATAMTRSEEVLRKILLQSRDPEPAIAVIVDIWAHRRNVPFLTTVVETVQEMAAPIKQRPEDQS